MASSLILKRASSSAPNLVNKIFNPIRSSSIAAAASPSSTTTRYFNTDSQMSRFEDNGGRAIDIDRPSDRSMSRRGDTFPSFFSDAFDPFSPSRSLSQMFNMMDQMLDNPFMAGSRGIGSGVSRRGWDVKEDDNALYFKVDMPGLGKEDLKVSVEQNTLIIRGEGGEEADDEQSRRRYSSRVDLPPNLYKTDEIKAEMKNGVLKVLVPKVKQEERKDVHQINVE